MTIAVGDRYLGTTPDLLKKVSCVFGGGIGGCREEICGALGGGVVVLGALWGRESLQTDDSAVYKLVCEWRRRFMEHFGESACAPIRDRVKLTEPNCLSVVMEATPMLVEIIEQALQDDPTLELPETLRA